MFTIYADNVLFYSDSAVDDKVKLLDPTLDITANTSGTLTFTMPETNRAYEPYDDDYRNTIIKKMSTAIRVFRGGNGTDEVWRGRVLQVDCDFMKRKKYVCEGAFSFFNDIIIPQADIHGTATEALEIILEYYNERATAERQILFDSSLITVNENVDIAIEDPMSVYEVLKEFFIDEHNGWFKIVFSNNGDMYLKYMAEGPTNSQAIAFGMNLLDFTKSYDYSEIVTVLLPLGPKNDTGTPMTIASVNDGSPYYIPSGSETSGDYAKYGRCEKAVTFDDVETPTQLLQKAYNYMNELKFKNMTLEVTALDLNYIDPMHEHELSLYDQVHCISLPHELDETFTVTEVKYDFNRPENTKFTIGPVIKKTISGELIVETAEETAQKEVEDAIKNADNIELMYAFHRYQIVQFMETNFEAIDARGRTIPRVRVRRYIRIYDSTILMFEDVLSNTIVDYKVRDKQIYWTSISGRNAYTYFTYQSPLTISKTKRPANMSDAQFEEQYKVKVFAASEHYEKARIGFYPINPQADTMEPIVWLGAGSGDQQDPNKGKGYLLKQTEGLDVCYRSRTTGEDFGVRIKDDGLYDILPGFQTGETPHIYTAVCETQEEAEAMKGQLPSGRSVVIVAPGSQPSNNNNNQNQGNGGGS